MTSEFDIIAAHFAPLARDPGAFGLKDDVALLPKGEHVVTKDMIIEGVHYLASDPLDFVARKLLRVNLSDLAAKGAKPIGYFLACAWSKKTAPADIALFAEGLRTDQDQFRISLFGGDTTRQKGTGPVVLSATFFGTPPRAGVIPRAGAASGDDLWVSGTIGDAGLGLGAAKKRESLARAYKDAL
ncbi:MAG: thiamine-phosphate kinase, partial [Parvularculaceae bacterium]|nr:thiamine-phosphate kinase [Parvularculaceae bacterium]